MTDDDPRIIALQTRVAELERRLAEPPPPLALTALRVLDTGWAAGWGLRPAPTRRAWMDDGPHAYKCLPMVVANQWGWQVTCPTEVVARWDGSPDPGGLAVDVDPAYAPAIKSQFGQGIITFSPPWLFRTPPGWDILAKGPANRWKPNCAPLEGIIETWWLNYTFTLNWKIVEPGAVIFRPGESLGQLVPVPHSTFQGATAEEVPILHAEPAAAEELLRWRAERRHRAQADAEAGRTHQLYRKAEGIPDHLARVDVPAVGARDERDRAPGPAAPIEEPPS